MGGSRQKVTYLPQWCIAKNRGGYTLIETPKASRIEPPKAARGEGNGQGCIGGIRGLYAVQGDICVSNLSHVKTSQLRTRTVNLCHVSETET